jgi:ACR3 family arsenite efflux pump ArsB
MARLSSHPESHLVSRIGWLRAAVPGANGGIVSTASLIVGVAAASVGNSEVPVAGVAGLVEAFLALLAADRIAIVFATLILLPLAAAFGLERWAVGRANRTAVVARLGWLPVPLLALVVFLIAPSQLAAVRDALPVLAQVAGVFVAYLIAAALLGAALGRMTGLPAAGQRTLIFSLGTRNSFVMLPLALALGSDWSTVAMVIVFQSLVEHFGMVGYTWVVLRFLVPGQPATAERMVP